MGEYQKQFREMQCMYVNITYRRVEVSNKASKVDGIDTLETT